MFTNTIYAVCQKYKLVKKQFLHNFHYEIVGWEVCDDLPQTFPTLANDLYNT